MTELLDKVIMVTGGASGLGEAIVSAAARAGARLAVVDLQGEAASKVAALYPGARSYRCDVSDPLAIKQVCLNVVADFGRLDGAVNNAGISGELAPLAEGSFENWNRVISINLTGVWACMHAEIPHLLANGGGSIINMASMAGVGGEVNLAPYTAAKHGVVGLTKVAALDYARQGIRCNAVCPSFVRTPMTMDTIPDEAWAQIDAMHPIGRTVTPEEVAHTVVFLLSDKSTGVTGSTHLLDGGLGAR